MYTYNPLEVGERAIAFGDGQSAHLRTYKEQAMFNKAEQARRAQQFTAAQASLGLTKPVLPMPPKSSGVRDMQGNLIMVGAKVARAIAGDVTYIRICTVTGTEPGKVYVDNSKVPVKHPSRLLIL